MTDEQLSRLRDEFAMAANAMLAEREKQKDNPNG